MSDNEPYTIYSLYRSLDHSLVQLRLLLLEQLAVMMLLQGITLGFVVWLWLHHP
jgi:hypothetical protein